MSVLTCCAVKPVRPVLEQPMPVNGGAIVCQLVRHVDNESVSPVDFDQRARKFPVDEDHVSHHAYVSVSIALRVLHRGQEFYRPASPGLP